MKQDNTWPESCRGKEASKEARRSLDEVLREGARRMLQEAIEAEVGDYLNRHAGQRLAPGDLDDGVQADDRGAKTLAQAQRPSAVGKAWSLWTVRRNRQPELGGRVQPPGFRKKSICWKSLECPSKNYILPKIRKKRL